jgi:hypothetical protein
MFERVTRKVKVSVQPAYLADQSAPDHNHYFWAYTVQIENESAETIQLRTATGASSMPTAARSKSRALASLASSRSCDRAKNSSTVPARRSKRLQA